MRVVCAGGDISSIPVGDAAPAACGWVRQVGLNGIPVLGTSVESNMVDQGDVDSN